MKKIAIAAVMTAGLTLAGCEANVKEEGEMPSMDVDVSGDAGELPEIDVETADVESGLVKNSWKTRPLVNWGYTIERIFQPVFEE